MNIFKIIGIGALVFLAGLIGIIIFAMIFFAPNENEINPSVLLKNRSFQSLHQAFLDLDSVKNIAVLPEEEYIVVDGVVINLKKRTFGHEPALGFYVSYYEEGSKSPYNSLESLFYEEIIPIDSIQFFEIVGKMRATDISDIYKHRHGISYRWKVSAMYGEEGIIYSKEALIKDSLNYDLIEPIGENFYHFVVFK